MDTRKLNNQRNECMDEIIDIEERKWPALYKDKLKVMSQMSLLSKKKRILWNRIKDIHKEIKRD